MFSPLSLCVCSRCLGPCGYTSICILVLFLSCSLTCASRQWERHSIAAFLSASAVTHPIIGSFTFKPVFRHGTEEEIKRGRNKISVLYKCAHFPFLCFCPFLYGYTPFIAITVSVSFFIVSSVVLHAARASRHKAADT